MFKSEEIVFAGFGGQGILSMGQILAYSAMLENKEVSWMPSYGPEMRGGTANCIVIISEGKISSPIVSKFDSAIIFNQPSLDKFEENIKPGGLLLYEESGIIIPPKRKDIEVHGLPAVQEAQNLKKKQVANMIMLGAFLEKRPLVKIENIISTLKKVLPERHHALIPLNEEALKLGKELINSSEQILK
jgi:2-oxoglutarate ferredoxin oxidoreductase subunit gamma